MHPKALLDACSELVKLVLKFDHPADAVVSRYFRDNRSLGPRERATLAETVYTVLRKKLLFDHLSPSGSGPKERRMAILGFHGPRDFLKSALTEQEKTWLDQCDSIKPADLLERHRHNLPEWLVQPLKQQLGDQFWASEASPDEKSETLGNYVDKLDKLTVVEYSPEDAPFPKADQGTPVLIATWYGDDDKTVTATVEIYKKGEGKELEYYATSPTTHVPVKVAKASAEQLERDLSTIMAD